jgi:hypothetical protein
VEFQLDCPKGHVVAGLDARLSVRPIEVSFLGKLGSPVNPGITTARSAVFVATYVGRGDRAPTFKPFIGCVPMAGGGSRVPTSVGSTQAFQPGAGGDEAGAYGPHPARVHHCRPAVRER